MSCVCRTSKIWSRQSIIEMLSCTFQPTESDEKFSATLSLARWLVIQHERYAMTFTQPEATSLSSVDWLRSAGQVTPIWPGSKSTKRAVAYALRTTVEQ